MKNVRIQVVITQAAREKRFIDKTVINTTIKEIKQYAELRAMGESTLYERMEMLINHRKALNIQILSLQEHMSKLDDKITFYQNEIERVQK